MSEKLTNQHHTNKSPSEKKRGMEKIYIIGFPKSGNTWLTRLLADILNAPAGSVIDHNDSKEIASDLNEALAQWNKPSGYKIIKTHCITEVLMKKYDPAIKRIVYIQRDFRDVVISAFFYKHRKKDIRESDVILSNFSDILRRGPLSILRYYRNRWLLWKCLNSICIQWDTTLKEVGSWDNHIDNALKFSARNPHIHMAFTTYEAMLHDTKSVVIDILQKLDLEIPPHYKIDQAIENQSFKNKKKYLESLPDNYPIPRGKEFNIKFMRKGVSGDWKNFFSLKMALRLHGALGDSLLKYGFENNPEWYRQPNK